MTSEEPKQSRKRRILDAIHLFISHHEGSYLSRCWHFTVRGHTLHVCARCSALLLGVILVVASRFWIMNLPSTPLTSIFIFLASLSAIPITPLTFFFAFLISLPATIDWSTQTLYVRESRNTVRAITGLLLGFAVGYVLSSFNIFYMLLVPILYAGWVLGLSIIASRKGRHLYVEEGEEESF
ncbi:MAG: DUF2085 domain-containing protein [Promethearchaeota archaeon]